VADQTEQPGPPAPPAAGAPGPGLLLKGRYRVERELGRGGVGVVYLARDEQLHDRQVVIKVLLERSAESKWFQKKFKQELMALVRIDHPGVVGALDAGEMPDGKPFFVMQFVPGVTLRSVMKGGFLPLPEVATIVRQVGGALSAAHEKGVHHRDLKPENIMLQDLGHGERLAKIIDFGIATVQEPGEEGTQLTQIAGTAFYMAPEQLVGKPEAASDIYALAVIAYEMLTGRLPFRPASTYELLALQRQGVKATPTQLRPDLPLEVDTVVLRGLALDPRGRPLSARAFADELAAALAAAAAQSGPLPARPAEPTLLVAAQPPSAGPTFVVPVQPSATPAAAPGTAAAPLGSLETAHVLFMDIVGYSKLPMDHQRDVLNELQTVVQATEDFQRAQAARELVSLPTGDGMALVFFRDPTAPLRCARDVARTLKSQSRIQLRMGIHGGAVYRVADINANLNVAGGGINVAQRVMDCGDAGHILLSQAAADVASQLSEWSGHLRDLGEHAVKHGARVHLFNLYTGEVGNPAAPSRLGTVAAEFGEKAAPRGRAVAGERERRGSRLPPLVLGGLALLALVGGVSGLLFWKKPVADGSKTTTVTAVRELAYFLTVQKYRNGQPYREPFQLAREMLFGPDDRLRVTVLSPQSGYLYMVSEGPEPRAGRPSYNVLYPRATGGSGSAWLAAGQQVQMPQTSWFLFDEQTGTESLWLVFAAATVPELEAVKGLANPKDRGVVGDPAQVEALHHFLAGARLPERSEDPSQARTLLKSPGDVLVSVLKLEHR